MINRLPLTDYMKSLINKRNRRDKILELKRLPGVTVIDGSDLNSNVEKIKEVLNAVIEAAGDKPLSDEDFEILMKKLHKKKDK